MSGSKTHNPSSWEEQSKEDTDEAGRGSITRRGFLRGAGLTAAGTALLDGVQAFGSASHTTEEHGLPELGPGPVAIKLNLNGKEHALEIEARTTLAETLRVHLSMTGTKVSCDRGACSACTVWIDGMTVCSCMMLAIDVGARNVTTIEGLASGDTLHPIQAAFIEHDAMQCGFCTPGMVMSCAALLEHIPNPAIADIHTAIGGHICRCGTYPHIVAATLAAAKARKA